MKTFHVFLFAALSLFSCQNDSNTGTEIYFKSSDNVTIYGDLFEVDKSSTSILLFHQGRSNARAEYKTIIPFLLKEGYNILAIDQRKGGQLYGSYNRTVAKLEKNEFTYCDTYKDLEAALDFIKESGFTGKKILWGSSYSASLAIQLAEKNETNVSAVLAFSPSSGGPMKDCKPDEYIKKTTVPILLLRPAKEMEIESVNKQFKLAQDNNHQTFIAKHGVHGSSMLVEERVKMDIKDNWNVVRKFLKAFD